jgi:hypothetical protein
MGVNTGYKIPENPIPEGMRCIALYVPDDDLYLYALGGAYQYMTTWLAWEKDKTDRASLAAQAWLAAYIKTMDELWTEGMIMTCTQVDELVNAINMVATAINNQELVVNAGGGGCCPADRQYKFPDGWEDDWPQASVPDGTTPHVGDNDYRCDAATAAIEDIRNFVSAFKDALLEDSPYAALVQLIAAIPLAIPSVRDLWVIVTQWVSSEYANMVMDINALLDDLEDDLICSIVNADSAEQAKIDFLNLIRADEQYPYQAKYFLEALLTGTSFNTIFDGTYAVPVEFLGSVCNCSDPVSLEWAWTFEDFGGVDTVLGAVTGTGLDNFATGGYLDFGGSIGARYGVSYTAVTDISQMNNVDAVSFVVDQYTAVPDGGNDGKRWTLRHGDINGSAVLWEPTSGDPLPVGYRVLIHRVGYSFNPADFDLTYQTGGVSLFPRFIIDENEFQPDENAVQLSVSQYTIHGTISP